MVGDEEFNVDYYVGGNKKHLCCKNDNKYCQEGAVQDCGGGCSCGAPVTFNPPGYFMANSEARNLAPGWRVEANKDAGVTDEQCNNAQTNQTTFTERCHYVNDATSQTAWFRCDDNPRTPTAPDGLSDCGDYGGGDFLFSADTGPASFSPPNRFRECWCVGRPPIRTDTEHTRTNAPVVSVRIGSATKSPTAPTPARSLVRDAATQQQRQRRAALSMSLPRSRLDE